MDSLIGYPLKEALNKLKDENKIINIKKIEGTNKKFNDLINPYVIREYFEEYSVTLFVSYY